MSWQNEGDDSWDKGGDTSNVDSGGADGTLGAADTAATNGDTFDDNTGGSNGACRICNQEGHFARNCPEKPAGGGITGECFNCGEVGHNKVDCTNPKVDRPFTGTCNSCGEEGHAARNCPTNPQTCKLCKQPGHKAVECKGRRVVDWTGIPEMDAGEAWAKAVNAANTKDIDAFRVALKAYARALDDQFDLVQVEQTLRDDNLPIFLIAKKQDVAINMTIVDFIGNPGREFVLSIQLSPNPRRKKMAEGWPESPEENLLRLASAGFVQDIGVPLCGNCGELGHIRKHCKEEVVEREKTAPTITCVYCQEVGHRARDCPKERINPYACKNCKQEGHNAKECPEPRSAENVECRKCSQMGHFSKDCPNVEARPPRTCRNCGSEDHIAKECDQPRNPDTVTCRNCEKLGHFSRDCPEPKDWSKVKCSNCGEMGHTVKRCKAAIADNDGGFGGDTGLGSTENDGAASGGWETGDPTTAAAAADAAGGTWDAGDAGGSGW